MKKIIALIAAIAIMFSFAACTKTENNGENNDTISSSYADLTVVEGLDLAVEEYGIGFRTGSDIVPEVNKIIKELYEDGTLKKIAEKYDLKDNLSTPIDAVAAELNPESDLEYVKGKGKMTIGYTVYAPMNYTNDAGEFVGFDTEFAKAVCEKLGIEPEFVEINWDTKEVELEAKKIDCIWNGMTITDERLANMSISVPYMNNKQVMVARKAK